MSKTERRRRDDLLIPFDVGRLEDRRVLSAPTITGAHNLATITQDGTNNGNLVSSLTINNTGSGIGISAVNNGSGAGGTWQYLIGSTWTNIPTIPNGNVFVLSNTDSVRFNPNSGFSGTSASITFYAWDGTGTDQTSIALNGTDFSSGTVASDIKVNAPTGPSIVEVGLGGTTSIFDDQTTKPFDNAANELSVMESDTSDTLSLTVTVTNALNDLTDVQGKLLGTGFMESSTGTYTLTGVNQTQATTDLQSLVFTPTLGTANTTFTLNVTDLYAQTVGPISTVVDVTANVPPTLTAAGNFHSIAAGATNPTGVEAQNLLTATDTEGNSIGVAIISVNNGIGGIGNWQYSTDNATSWQDIPASSSTSAFLLAPTDQVRFLPAAGYGGTASIQYFAWDGTAGSADLPFDTTQSPGSEAFSATSGTTSISVIPTIAISGTATTDALAGQTPAPTPFSGVKISDTASNNDVITVTITQQFGNGVNSGQTDQNTMNGVLSLSGVNSADLMNNRDGTYTLTGSVSQVQADLQQLTFTPASPAVGDSTTTKFGLDISDTLGATDALDDSTEVIVSNPPTLTSVANFNSIPAGSTSSPSYSESIEVSSLIDASPAGDGAAVVGVDDTNGIWQYATNGGGSGANWAKIPDTVSSTNAFLLNPGDYVRFKSTSGVAATPTITLLAWDPSDGGTADALNDPATAPGAYSTIATEQTASITVYPVLSISGTSTIMGTYVNGQTLAAFTGVTLSDSDGSESVTVTITQMNSGGIDTGLTDGSLSLPGGSASATFTVNTGAGPAGAGTYTLTDTSLANLQADLLALVFTPTAGTPGASVTTSFQLALSDGSAPANTFTTTATPTDTNQILIVKSPPLLNGANPLTAEDPNTVTSTEVSALIYDPTQVTDPSDSALGIAIIGLTDNTAADGKWQYSTAADPTHWIDLSTPTGASTAFLLANTDNIRFLPKSSFHGAPTITFLAWDGSAGTSADVDTAYDATTAATLGAFSTVATAATSTVAVRPVLSIMGTGATSINDDQQTTPFDNGTILAVIGDTNTTETVTVVITQMNAGGIDTTLSDGSLSLTPNTGPGPMGAGTYTLTGNATAVTSALQALVFTPNPGTVGDTVVTTFEIMVTDGPPGPGTAIPQSDSATQVTTLSIASPTLTGANNLQPVPLNADPTINSEDPGIEVENLPAAGSSANIGIAISAVDDMIGTWEYSTDGTAASPTWIAISGVSATSVLLLAPTDYIRFVPNTGELGSSTITLQAWNQFSGTVDTVNATSALLTRGLSSTPAATATVEVVPVLSIGATHTSASLDDQIIGPFGGVTIGDTDAAGNVYNEQVTITITAGGGIANGVLTSSDSFAGFSSNGSGTYTLTADNAADAQAELHLLVFTPTLHEVSPGGTVQTQFTIQLSDTFGSANGKTDATSVLTVTANATPLLNGANPLNSIPENVASANDPGVTVASLISGGNATDSDGDSLGIAVTAVDDSNGTWYYSTNGSSASPTWTPISGVSATSALLLAPGDYVQFVPNANFFDSPTATLPTIQFQAWDQTVGTAAQLFNTTTLPFAGAFSDLAAASASIQVVAPATIFAATPSVQTTDEASINVFQSAFGPAGTPAPGITDPNTPAQTYTVTVQIDTPANGKFQTSSLADWTSLGNSTYRFTGTAVAANTALNALIFVPTAHQVKGGDSVTTDFTITVDDGVNTPVSNIATTGSTNTPISVTVAAVVDPPSFVTQPSTNASLPVLAPNGTVISTSARATDLDASPNITYSITAGNSAGAYSIDADGNIIVADNAALSYSPTPTVLTISAQNIGDHGVTSAIVTTTRTIYVWAVTASATPITADSSTTVTLTLLYPTAPSPPALTVGPLVVAWDDGTVSSASLSSTSPTVSLTHFYATNPDKADPAASIPIAVTGADVSVQASAPVAGTGVGIAVIPQTTTSFVELVAAPALEAAPTLATADQQVTQAVDLGVAESQATVGSDRQVALRIVSPLGDEGSSIPVPDPDRALNDLPGLFKKLPDGRYRVYLSEGGHERLVIDVVVRQGRPVDSSEDASGASDRPPTSQTESDKADGLVNADPSAPKGQAAAALQKQTTNGTGQPAIGGSHQNTPPSGQTPGATQTTPRQTPTPLVPPSNPPAVGMSTAAMQPIGRSASNGSEDWVAWMAARSCAATAGAAAVASVAVDPQRADEFMEKLRKRSLSKGARLTRWLQKTANVE